MANEHGITVTLRPVHTRQQRCRKRQQIVAGNGNYVSRNGDFVVENGNLVAENSNKLLQFAAERLNELLKFSALKRPLNVRTMAALVGTYPTIHVRAPATGSTAHCSGCKRSITEHTIVGIVRCLRAGNS